MKRFESEDEPIRFYLQHRRQIEDWARVGREDLPAFVSEFYVSLHQDLKGRTPVRGIDIENDVEVVKGEQFIRLRRRYWPETIAVELGWHNIVGFSNQEIWRGIHVEGGTESSYWDDLIEAKDRPEAASYRLMDRRYGYPMYEYLNGPNPNFWEGNNLEEYGNVLIEALLQAWRDLALLVDESVSQSSQ